MTSDPKSRTTPTDTRLLGAGYQGQVYAEHTADGLRVVKCASGLPLIRQFRRAMIRREYTAYRRLAGFPGIPRCLGLRDNGELVLEFIDARPLRETGHDLPDRDAFFGELGEIIRRMHTAGVAHTDLKRKDNILVDTSGRPWVIDFGACILLGDSPGRMQTRLFDYFCQVDLNAWIKLKYQYRVAALTAEDRAIFRPTALEAVARALRPAWRLLTFRALRKASRRRRESPRDDNAT